MNIEQTRAALERAAVTMQAQRDDDDAALLRALADALKQAQPMWQVKKTPHDLRRQRDPGEVSLFSDKVPDGCRLVLLLPIDTIIPAPKVRP